MRRYRVLSECPTGWKKLPAIRGAPMSRAGNKDGGVSLCLGG